MVRADKKNFLFPYAIFSFLGYGYDSGIDFIFLQNSNEWGLFWFFVVAGFWLAAAFFFRTIKKKEREKALGILKEACVMDSAWEEEKISRRIAEIFFKFQEAWGHFDIYGLRACVTENYYQLLVMEMGVLKRCQRQNFALIPQIRNMSILKARDEADNEKDMVIAEIAARMDNVLIDTENSEMLLANYGYFRQYWVFRRENGIWKADAVRSDLERPEVRERMMKGFAQRNGFYYDPDFGQIVIPNKGVLFRKTKFGRSRSDNYVIGNLDGKIVEFFTYNPRPAKKRRAMPGSDEKRKMLEELENPYGDARNTAFPDIKISFGYIVAQAIIAETHYDILIKRRGDLFDFAPKGMKKCKGLGRESNEYFSVFADPRDDINAFCLTDDVFLNHLKEYPFGLNIEAVGSFLYVYVKANEGITFERILDIMKIALNEIEGSAKRRTG